MCPTKPLPPESPGGALSDPADLKPYLTDSRHLLQGNTPVVLRPSDTQQVAEIVKLCASAGISITIAGGRTGTLAGGAVFRRPTAQALSSASNA